MQIQPSVDVLSAYFNGDAAMLGKAAMKICQSAPGTLRRHRAPA
jgi:hypothetical protein